MAQKPEDWHPADVIAALHKRRITLRSLAIQHGYEARAAGKALRQAWPAMERVIATALGLKPHEIWPSRYRKDGTPKRARIARNSITGGSARNVHRTAAA